jgi:hypothetical protein
MSAKGKSASDAAVEAVVENKVTAVPSQGVRARRAIMLKEFIPTADFINVQVVAKGKGTKVMLGRIYGFVTGVMDKTNTLPNGEKAASVVCNGQFETENYLTGEISAASSVYFPSSFSETIKAMFAADPDLKMIEVDTDVGLEATGKTIPYTWVVINYVEGEAVTPLKKLRAARVRPDNVPALAAPKAPAQITQQ